MNKIFFVAILWAAFLVSGCASTKIASKDYTKFYAAAPASILVVPVINHSNEVNAADLFLTTMAVPLSERGFYVFPTNAVRGLMENEGLSDPGFVHQASTIEMASLFGADAVLYVEVLDWASKYKVIANNIEVEFLYTLKSGETGEVLWQDQRKFVDSRSSSSGNILADLLVNALLAVADNTRSDFSPYAIRANVGVLSPAGTGMPFGPHSPLRKENKKLFLSTGTESISNAKQEAVSAPGLLGPSVETE